jgi:hypothetical protein
MLFGLWRELRRSGIWWVISRAGRRHDYHAPALWQDIVIVPFLRSDRDGGVQAAAYWNDKDPLRQRGRRDGEQQDHQGKRSFHGCKSLHPPMGEESSDLWRVPLYWLRDRGQIGSRRGGQDGRLLARRRTSGRPGRGTSGPGRCQ